MCHCNLMSLCLLALVACLSTDKLIAVRSLDSNEKIFLKLFSQFSNKKLQCSCSWSETLFSSRFFFVLVWHHLEINYRKNVFRVVCLLMYKKYFLLPVKHWVLLLLLLAPAWNAWTTWPPKIDKYKKIVEAFNSFLVPNARRAAWRTSTLVASSGRVIFIRCGICWVPRVRSKSRKISKFG